MLAAWAGAGASGGNGGALSGVTLVKPAPLSADLDGRLGGIGSKENPRLTRLEVTGLSGNIFSSTIVSMNDRGRGRKVRLPVVTSREVAADEPASKSKLRE